MSYKSNIWKMYLFKFLISLHFVNGVLIPFFMGWGGLSFTWVMILQSFFVMAAFFMEIPTGAIADYIGRKTSLIIGAVLGALAALAYSLYPNLLLFFLAEFIWAVGVALFTGADEALVYDSLKKYKAERKSKKIFGRFMSFEAAALMIAAPIGSFIAATIGVRYTMMFVVIPFLAAAILGLTFKEPRVKRKVKKKKYLKTMVEGVSYFKSHSVLKIMTFDRVLIGGLVFFIIWLYQPLLIEMEVPIIYFGFIMAGMTGVQILFLNSLGRLESLFRSKRRYLYWSAVIAGVGFVLLGLLVNVWLAVILFLLISGFGFSRETLFRNYMNKHIESGHRATVISSISMVDRVVGTILYPLVGLLVDRSLSWSFILIGLAILVVNLLSRVREEHLID